MLLVFVWGDVLLELDCCFFFFENLGLSFFLNLWARPVGRARFRCVFLAILRIFEWCQCVLVLCICWIGGWYYDIDFGSCTISIVVI